MKIEMKIELLENIQNNIFPLMMDKQRWWKLKFEIKISWIIQCSISNKLMIIHKNIPRSVSISVVVY